MSNTLLVNVTGYEIRIGLLENGNLTEFYLERPAERGLVGNIYKGRVVRVLPGMQAAFVEVGLDRTGFLYVDDVVVNDAAMEKRLFTSEQENGNGRLSVHSDLLPGRRPLGMNIENLLTEGQEILVQIAKEPIGTKGARLTCHITLPCRNLVFMPMTDHIGISRKIEDEEVKKSLRDRIESLRPMGTGFIVRTMAENAPEAELEADMEFLLHLWSEIEDTAAKATAPCLVHEDLDLALRTVRDLMTPEMSHLVVDNRVAYEKILRFVNTFAPELTDKVSLYERHVPLFEAYGVEVDVNRALDKKIWLRSGGYIIIEDTEALTVIDVNTGRYVGKSDLEETIFKTNMEAAREIAFQLRLRNIGGIIIIDFIDMEDEHHREEVFNALQEVARKDKSRTNILRLSEFGLVQMTRKRDRDDLLHLLCEPCPYCGGEGLLKSRRSICYEIFRKITGDSPKKSGAIVKLKVHPRVADIMLREEPATIERLETQIGKEIVVVPINAVHIKNYDIIWEED